MKFHTRFDWFHVPPISFPEDDEKSQSLTHQEFKAECDMNEILKRFRVTGQLTDPSKPAIRRPVFGDFSEIPDELQRANIKVQAQAAWDALPSNLQDRFQSPQEMLQFLSDENNREEAISLGIIKAKAAGAATPGPQGEAAEANSPGSSQEDVTAGLCGGLCDSSR